LVQDKSIDFEGFNQVRFEKFIGVSRGVSRGGLVHLIHVQKELNPTLFGP